MDDIMRLRTANTRRAHDASSDLHLWIGVDYTDGENIESRYFFVDHQTRTILYASEQADNFFGNSSRSMDHLREFPVDDQNAG